MSVFLVRHAKAGSRGDWDGPDHLRPISRKGQRQAEAIAELLRGEGVKRVMSSRFVRCVQTVRPLADLLGLDVEVHDALAEGASIHAGIALVEEAAGDNAVLCSHGDVIPALLDALHDRDGLAIPPGFDFAKGSTWVIEGPAPPFVVARYVAPIA